MNVYVFKTSITPQNVSTINRILKRLIPNCQWNYDLEDCDNILRVESRSNIVEVVRHHLRTLGFYCEELE